MTPKRFCIAWSWLSTISAHNGHSPLVWLDMTAADWSRLMRYRSTH